MLNRTITTLALTFSLAALPVQAEVTSDDLQVDMETAQADSSVVIVRLSGVNARNASKQEIVTYGDTREEALLSWEIKAAELSTEGCANNSAADYSKTSVTVNKGMHGRFNLETGDSEVAEKFRAKGEVALFCTSA